jgi:hypothetical protein
MHAICKDIKNRQQRPISGNNNIYILLILTIKDIRHAAARKKRCSYAAID